MPNRRRERLRKGVANDFSNGSVPAMLKEIIIRMLVGGLAVSAFAILGDIVKPKSFAGLFGAAPSIALATLLLTIFKEGPGYAAIEGRSMLLGAFAFFLYAWVVMRAMLTARWSALRVTIAVIPVWCVSALGLWQTLLK